MGKATKGSGDGQSVNERILKECHKLYADDKQGLCVIAKDIDINLLAPRKKITVMLIGNHSAGKSSFINWYIEEVVQRTGVAIETQGFSIVTSGRKRESLTGNATLHLYQHLKPLQNMEGVTDYINTEITTSRQKKFGLVTLIDTPGLVDGDMKYPFDVNKAILWMGENIADLIFVFFDPIGQALCKRTLNIVEQLSTKKADVMKFFLSKADDAGDETDRQRVMMQIVQELCKRPGLNRTGFDMSTIYIPKPGRETKCVNQIDTACKEIEKTIGATIQNTLNTLERDCTEIADKIDFLIEQDDRHLSHNLRAKGKGGLFLLSGLIIPLLLVANFIASMFTDESLDYGLGVKGRTYLRQATSPVASLWNFIPEAYHWHLFGFFTLVTLGFVVAARLVAKTLPTIARRRKKLLIERRGYVQSQVIQQKEQLYHEYLQQSVAAHDL